MTAPPPVRPARLPRPRRFRADLGLLIAGVVLGLSLLLLGLGYWGAQRLVSAIGESAHRASHLRVADQVSTFLSQAASAVDAVAATTALPLVGAPSQQTIDLLWALLHQAPALDRIYVADDTGRVLMAQRRPELAVVQLGRNRAAASETWQYPVPPEDPLLAPQRMPTERISAFGSQYDPRLRGWFAQAAQSSLPLWTAPYTFSHTQELGLTHAVARRRATPDEVLQVVSGDVALARLSDLVREFSSGGEGESALLSAEQQVLARSDMPGRPQTLLPPRGGVLGTIHARLVAGHGPQGANADGFFPIRFEGRRYLVQTSRIAATQWQLVSWVPEDRLLGALQRGVVAALGVVMVFLVLVLLLSLRMARRMTAPVEQLARIARRIGALDLDRLPRVHSPVREIRHLDQALDESARGIKAFRRFVPVDVLRRLLAEGRALEPSGEPREITVMFTDVRGFARIAESTPPDVLVEQLTQYFNAAAVVIARHGGTLDKFIGDAIMVLWGAPTELPEAPLHACRAALALLEELDALNARWRLEGRQAFETCIGIHTGPVVVGLLGARDRLAYTAVGDTVNVASRIEGLNRELGTRVLVSESTAQALAGQLPTRRVQAAELRGRQRPLPLYELLAPAPAAASSAPTADAAP